MRARIVGAVMMLTAALITPLLMTAPASAASPTKAPSPVNAAFPTTPAAAGPDATTAVTCGPGAPDLDPDSSVVINPEPGFSGPAMRTGPGSNCPLQTRPPWGSTVYLYCYRFGDTYKDTTSWSAVRYGGYLGWINDHFLSGYGSGYSC